MGRDCLPSPFTLLLLPLPSIILGGRDEITWGDALVRCGHMALVHGIMDGSFGVSKTTIFIGMIQAPHPYQLYAFAYLSCIRDQQKTCTHV